MVVGKLVVQSEEPALRACLLKSEVVSCSLHFVKKTLYGLCCRYGAKTKNK
jgi:hypothetical protein